MNFGQVMQLQKAKDINATQVKVEQPTETKPEKEPQNEEVPTPQEPVEKVAQSETPKAKPSVTRSVRKQSKELDVSAKRVATVKQLVSDYVQKQTDGLRLVDTSHVRLSRSVYLKLWNLKAICGIRLHVLLAVIVDWFMRELDEGLIDEKLNSQ